MYRILAAQHGGVRERRDQLTHPAYAKPELLAERPNELWSWDVSQAEGPGEVDLLLPVRDPRRVQPLRRRLDGPVPRERPAREGADRAGHRAAADHPQDPDAARRPRLRRSAPSRSRSSSRTSASRNTHSRPYTSSDNPYSEANFKTLKYRPEFPDRFDDIEHARAHCRGFFDWYNHPHRHSGIGLMTPAAVHHGHAPELHAARADVLDAAYAAPPRAVRPQAAGPARAADRRLDQQARHEGGRSLNSNAKRLIGLDRLRPARRDELCAAFPLEVRERHRTDGGVGLFVIRPPNWTTWPSPM